MAELRPFEPSDRVRLVPAATRVLGDQVLVNAGGAAGPVERLVGRGPDLWWWFDQGLTIAEAAARLAAETGTRPTALEPHVGAFAAALVDAGLAEPPS